MQDLKVIGIEDGALLAASDDGERYRLAIDEVLHSKLRQLRTHDTTSPRIPPREIQAHIRGGLSAEDVAELTGASLEYVQRFEGPIIAEREHIVSRALAVPVRTSTDVDVLGESAAGTFGTVIRERLAALHALGERWAAWKDEEAGWIVKLAFTADDIDHDARWNFEPRKNSLTPANAEATTLSQQGELPQTGLIPRLRAVTPLNPDRSRFDTGAFEPVAPAKDDTPVPFAPAPSAFAPTPSTFVSAAAHRSQEERPRDVQQTADLLEALRRRRGERDAAASGDVEDQGAFAPGEQREASAPDFAEDAASGPDAGAEGDTAEVRPLSAPVVMSAGGQSTGQTGQLGTRGSRRGRASMPSWDEIVFGARGDDDNLA